MQRYKAETGRRFNPAGPTPPGRRRWPHRYPRNRHAKLLRWAARQRREACRYDKAPLLAYSRDLLRDATRLRRRGVLASIP